MAAADAPAAAAVAKAKYQKHDNPPGIFFKDKDKKLCQARILGENDQGKRVRITRPIPGVFKGVDAAVEAQAAAQLKWDSGEAVWPVPPAIGCHARGQVIAPFARTELPVPVPSHERRVSVWRARRHQSDRLRTRGW